MSDSEIDRHVRRIVGIATLRRLRRMVDSENANDARQAMLAKRLGVLLSCLALVFVVVLAASLYVR